jgi:hypothetical protein
LKITIDNHDGLGPIDYTQRLSGGSPFMLHRKLNQVSLCTLLLDCNAAGFAVPAKYGRVIAVSDAGVFLFTGYIALTPAATLVGAGSAGLLYVQEVTLLSDEMMLDQQGTPVTSGSTGLSVQTVLQALTQRIDRVRFSVLPDKTLPLVGKFVAEASKTWSTNAGVLMSMARTTYRMLNQQLTVVPVGKFTHILSDMAGTLDMGRFSIAQAKSLANDVSVCGESEPQAYVTDVFQGDGVTTTFQLTRKPKIVATIEGALIEDAFQGPMLNNVLWALNDPGSRISLTAAGLSVNGGNGVDGQTALTSVDNMEMGGALVLTAGGVQVSAESAGYVGCFYNGNVLLQNLFAGFGVTQSGGQTVVTPILNGVSTGAAATLAVGHVYSFRLRFYCTEVQRVFASYYVDGGAGQRLFGGGQVSMPAQLVFELQDTTGGVNQAPIVLYDGASTVTPTTCLVCAINSTAFTGSIQTMTLEQTGTAWVRSQQASGSAFTRRIGLATVGADCKVDTTAKLIFYATSVPQAGELITVSYRTAGNAVARLQNAASVLADGTAVVPGVSAWKGTVTNPVARSSADCENAALALLAVATNPSAAWAGKYEMINAQQVSDIWPGDALALQSATLGLSVNLIIRSVTITCIPEQPETLMYTLDFANDWAEALSMKTSSAVPKETWLPRKALTAPTSLANLTSLVAVVTPSQINVIAGANAPAGGGFEVRRVDWQFGTGSDGTLVLRSSVPNFSIIREAAIEQYYIRMYDGSTPPNYSRFSNAICISVPL